MEETESLWGCYGFKGHMDSVLKRSRDQRHQTLKNARLLQKQLKILQAQEESLRMKPTLLVPRSETPSFQNHGEIKVCCQICQICAIWYGD